MKKLSLLLSSLFLVLSLNTFAQEDAKEVNPNAPVITFESDEVDYGTIDRNSEPQRVIKFKNTGKTPLIISNATATCGCTVPSWPKEPVAPGKSAEIRVSFNSAGKMGKQNSIVRIYSNASEPIEKVSLISNVLPKTN